MRILSLALIVMAIWAGVAPARLSVLIVDDDGPADFSTIQSAVDAAQPGDTVLIQSGTYRETVLIYNKNDLTLQGTHRDTVKISRAEAGTLY
jgi:pectin methylesterase-like acyl-CoA thioesterase